MMAIGEARIIVMIGTTIEIRVAMIAAAVETMATMVDTE